MAVIALGLLALAVFAALAEGARHGSKAARVGTVIEAAVLVPLAGFGALVALALLGIKCDESCDENLSPAARSGEWWHSLDAWQWWGQSAVAVVGFVAVGGALASVVRGNYRLATALMVIAAAGFGAWAAFLAPLGHRLGI